jgi:Holliday junction resolvase RusA-like endonuclease
MELKLPVPPSVNAAYANRRGTTGRGRYKTASYHRWLIDADAYYTWQNLGRVKPITGPYRVSIVLPKATRGDIDNRVKLTMDWLVSRNLTPDDCLCRSIRVERGPTFASNTMMLVRVTNIRDAA